MATIQHEVMTYAEQHVIHRFEYADATAREAASGFSSSDVKKLAYQLDTDAYWVLTDHSPITWVQVTTGSVYTKSEVDVLLAALSAVPTGTISATGRSTAPSGYLLCDGSAVSRTTYSDLFTAIGTGYGSGNGSTTFNVPDLQGNFPRGKDADALGDSDGDETKDGSHSHTTGDHAITEAELAAHTHNVRYWYAKHDYQGGPTWYDISVPTDLHTPGQSKAGTVSTGSGNAHNHGSTGSEGSSSFDVMNPYLVVNYMIKT